MSEQQLSRPAPNAPDDVYHRYWMAKVLARVRKDDNGCWIWQGGHDTNGYGSIQYRGKTMPLHRQMYKVFHGVSLLTKQYVCHKCDTRRCCNPDHLFLGTQFDNMADSVRKGRHAEQLVTHCPKGHEYDAENTYIVKKANGKTSRDCKTCARARGRIRAGWPEDLAYSLPAVSHGYRPINAQFKRARSQA